MNHETDDLAPREVLYVEDHPTNVQLMRAIFKRRPQLKLVVAFDGGEALTLAARMEPALLLLDLRLPDCHGVQLLHELRQREGWDAIPAIAVTAEPGFRMQDTGFC